MLTTTPPIRSLSELGAATGRLDLPSLALKLYGFLAKYQLDNGGATPAYNVMANELPAPEETVKRLLGMLENQGRITFISKNPPAIMLGQLEDDLKDGVIKQPRPGAYERFLDAEASRHSLARIIWEHEQEFGTAPSLAYLQRRAQVGTLSYVDQMLAMLARRGLVERTQAGPRLTVGAKIFYGFKEDRRKEPRPVVDEPAPVPTPKPGGPKVVLVYPDAPSDEKKGSSRVNDFCQVLAHATNRQASDRKWLTHQLGMSPLSRSEIGHIAARAVEQGLVEPFPRNQRGVRFKLTEKGKEKFMSPAATTPSPTPPARPTRATGPNNICRRIDALCETLAAHFAEGYTRSPDYSYLAERIGLSPENASTVSRVVHGAVEAGFIEPFPPKSQGRLRFTEKGRRKFMPAPAEEPVPEPAVEPVDRSQRPWVEMDAIEAQRRGDELFRQPKPAETFEVSHDTSALSLTSAKTLADYTDEELRLELMNRGYMSRKVT